MAVAVAPKDAFGPQGGNEQIGVGKNDTLVFVLDVVKAYMTRADGADQPAKAGMPAVVLAENGAPGITVPAAKAPTELEIAVLKKGTGKKVKEGDPVTVHYTGVIWDTKKVFDSSWETRRTRRFAAADGSDDPGRRDPRLR